MMNGFAALSANSEKPFAYLAEGCIWRARPSWVLSVDSVLPLVSIVASSRGPLPLSAVGVVSSVVARVASVVGTVVMMVGMVLGAVVYWASWLVQPQPVNSAAVRTRANAMERIFFIG